MLSCKIVYRYLKKWEVVKILSDDRVQIIVRTTLEEKEKIKEIAKSKKKSMNQLIIDSVVDSTNDSGDSSVDSTVIDVFKDQLENKDKQIDKLQNLLDQQQQLSLQSNKQIEQLQLQLSNEAEIDLEHRNKVVNEKDTSEANEKKSFFNRIFKK